LTEQGFGKSRPEDVTRAAQVPPGQPPYGAAQGQGEAYPGQGEAYPGQGAAYPGQGAAGYAAPTQDVASTKGFVSALFDFGFNSFVTPKVVKVVYVLIMIVLGLAGLAFALSAFTYSAIAGIFVLLIVAPLFFFVYLALWRIVLEIFVVIFRIADDLRAIRERGGLH
jgi:Domain of unknown function (DUF4282)